MEERNNNKEPDIKQRMLTSALGAVAVQAYYGLPMLIVSAIVVAIVYRAIEAHWFYIGIDLVREKPGGKRFSLWTRFMFYIDCSSLYNDVWHKVRLLVATGGASHKRNRREFVN